MKHWQVSVSFRRVVLFEFLVRCCEAHKLRCTSTCKCHFKPVRQFEMCVVYALAYAHRVHRVHMGTGKTWINPQQQTNNASNSVRNAMH